MSSSSSESSSSSSSSSSSGADARKKKRQYKQQALVSGEGSSRVAAAAAPLAASSATLAAAVAPLAAAPAKPLRAVPLETAPQPTMVDKLLEGDLSKPTAQPFNTVRYEVNVRMPLSALEELEKSGQPLKLLPGKGLSAKPRYSNAADAAPDVLKSHGDCDFVRSARLVLAKCDAGVPLKATLPIKALPNETDMASPAGFISATVDSGENVLLARTVTEGHMVFVGKYPGQTVDTLSNFMFNAPNMPDVSYVQAKPEAAVLYFYNRNANVIAQGATIDASHADKHGMASVPRALLEAAKREAEESIRTKIGYTNVTDPAKMQLVLETLPIDTLTAGGSFESRPVSLAQAHLESSLGRQVTAVAQYSKAPSAALEAQKAASYVTLQGYLEFEYVKVHPNFQLKPVDD